MHTIIDQLIPPNVVNFSRKFSAKTASSNPNFDKQEFLACVKTNLVEVYTINPSNGCNAMELFSKHTFVARIESIEVISRPENDSDWILITFPDCKMTIFEFNGLINDFVARSLHFFERENYRTGVVLGTSSNLSPILSCDPDGRMAAVRVFSSHLALIPIPKDIPEHQNDSKAASEHSLQSHVVNFATQIDSRLKMVKNLIFLPGFGASNPVIAILYDRGSNEGENDNIMPLRSALNHSHSKYPKDTCALMIVAIEPTSKHRIARNISNSSSTDSNAFNFTVINCIEGLPFDCEDLFALPKPVGGLFITCANLLLWCDVSSSTAPLALPLNQFAALTYSGRINPLQESLNLSSLLDCRFIPLQPSHGNTLRCIFLTKHGEKLVATISRTGRTLSSFTIERIEHGAKISQAPSDLIQWNDELIFVASEGGNSQLLSLIKTEMEKESDNGINVNVKDVPVVPILKSAVVEAAPPLNLDDDIDAFLYGEDIEMTPALPVPSQVKLTVPDDDYLMSLESDERTIINASKTTKDRSISKKSKTICYNETPQFELIDELESLGPAIDLAVGSSETGSTELVSIGGAFTDRQSGLFYPGSVNVLSQTIPPAIQLSFTLPETRRIWTINTLESETRYLVASTPSSTLVLTTSQARIVELEESDFYLEGPTLYCSACFEGKFILQVYPSGLKLLNLASALLLKEIQGHFSGFIKFACGPDYFYMLHSDGSLKGFDKNLVPVNAFSNVSSFTCKGDLLFISFKSGALSILNSGDGVVFENYFFSRLPVTLTNRKGLDKSISDLCDIDVVQRIISLDIIGDTEVLAVRYECQKSIGLVSYRIINSGCGKKNNNILLQRITSELLGMSLTAQVESSNVLNEAVLYEESGCMPVYTFALNSRNYPRLHVLFPVDRKDSEKIIFLASYNQSSLMVLKDNGVVSIVDLVKTRKNLDLNWQSGWYLNRVKIENTQRVPTHVTFHETSKTYLVASAELSSDFVLPADEYAPISDNQNTPPYTGTVPKLFGATSNALHLLNPISWTVVDDVMETFLPFEGVTCIRSLELETRQTATGFSPFLTVGTAYQKGEDRPIRGRTLVYDVSEVVPEPGKPETNRKLRLKGITDFKGPVMALTPLRQGHVVISAGAKVIVNTFEEDEKFAGVAFQDIGTCTLSMASLKNFFVTADLVNSIAFLAFQAEPLARIHELGRDFGQNLQCTAVEFVINYDGNAMMVVSDDQGGLHFFSYAPNNLTTNSGQRLLDKGSFYLHGAPVNKLYRLPLNGGNDDFGVLAAKQDGSISLITPVKDVTMFRRLFMLEIRLGTVLPASGGLVSRISRQVPKRMTVNHALPATTCQYTVTLPTSSIRAAGDQEIIGDRGGGTLNSTIILHHLPVSNSVIDAQAIKRLHSDPLCDGLARQIFANRFGVDFATITADVNAIYSNFHI